MRLLAVEPNFMHASTISAERRFAALLRGEYLPARRLGHSLAQFVKLSRRPDFAALLALYPWDMKARLDGSQAPQVAPTQRFGAALIRVPER